MWPWREHGTQAVKWWEWELMRSPVDRLLKGHRAEFLKEAPPETQKAMRLEQDRLSAEGEYPYPWDAHTHLKWMRTAEEEWAEINRELNRLEKRHRVIKSARRYNKNWYRDAMATIAEDVSFAREYFGGELE